MVRGLDIFKDHFAEVKEQYILIGGAACDKLFSGAGLSFRATKDLDLILVVEALDERFVAKFWEFIRAGAYQSRQKSSTRQQYYRFKNPRRKNYPAQLELFSRKPDLLKLAPGTYLAPIPTPETYSNLSAILLDDDYYNFILGNSQVIDDLHLATIEALLCFKVKAFLELRALKANGVAVDDRDIRKHKNDVVRLSHLLREDSRVKIPESIKNDMRSFIGYLEQNPPDIKAIIRPLGFNPMDLEYMVEILERVFAL